MFGRHSCLRTDATATDGHLVENHFFGFLRFTWISGNRRKFDFVCDHLYSVYCVCVCVYVQETVSPEVNLWHLMESLDIVARRAGRSERAGRAGRAEREGIASRLMKHNYQPKPEQLSTHFPRWSSQIKLSRQTFPSSWLWNINESIVQKLLA